MSGNSRSSVNVAIIGAGMAGMTCATTLHAMGYRVTLLEKSHAAGGRLAPRRDADGRRFDHGAQFATARGDGFRDWLEQCVLTGRGRPWTPRQTHAAHASASERIIGVPGMDDLLPQRPASLALHASRRVTGIERAESGWHLQFQDGTSDASFDAVVCAVPAPQARALLGALDTRMDQALGDVTMAPCWALSVRFAQPPPWAFDLASGNDGPIALRVRQAARRHGEPDTRWVMHAGPEWSARHLEETPAVVAGRMLSTLRARPGALPDVVDASAHRWRHARTTKPLGQPCLGGAGGTLVAAGDWCLGARIEYAFDSGRAAAAAVAAALPG